MNLVGQKIRLPREEIRWKKNTNLITSCEMLSFYLWKFFNWNNFGGYNSHSVIQLLKTTRRTTYDYVRSYCLILRGHRQKKCLVVPVVVFTPMCLLCVWNMRIHTILAEPALYPRGAQTRPSHRVTRASILTTAQAVAGLPIGPLWTSWRGRGVGVGKHEERASTP